MMCKQDIDRLSATVQSGAEAMLLTFSVMLTDQLIEKFYYTQSPDISLPSFSYGFKDL